MPDGIHLLAAAVLGLAVLYLATAPTLIRRIPARTRAVDRLVRRVRVPLPGALRPAVTRQLAAYHLGADVGGALGVIVATLWSLTWGRALTDPAWWILVVFSSMLLGVALGAGVAAVRDAGRPRDGTHKRVARPSAPTLGDYVAPLERQGAWVVGALPLLLAGVSFVVGTAGNGSSTSPSVLWIVVLVSLGALAGGEWGARRVLAAGQPAGSDLELLWSDALRAHTLRAVFTVPIAVGTYASIWVLGTMGLDRIDPRSGGGITLGVVFILGAIAAVGAALWSLSGAPHRHFKTRLWPADAGVQRVARGAGRS